jgi:DNA topoisomerase-1
LYKNLNVRLNPVEENEDTDENVNENDTLNAKLLIEGTVLDMASIKAHQEYEKPPARYNEASLLNKLDLKNLNIGRPATLVPMIQKIIEKKYIEVKEIKGKDFKSYTLLLEKDSDHIVEEAKTITLGKEKNKYVPTKLGLVITNYLTLHFSKIMDYQFTAKMEEKLDEIANGKLIWHEVVKEFYDEFHPLIMARVSVNNINKGLNSKLLGKYENKDIYVTNAKYGPAIKYIDGLNVKYLKIVEPLSIDTITLEEAIQVIEGNSGYPKLIGLFDRKKVILRKNGDSYYISYDKKTFPSDKDNLTID